MARAKTIESESAYYPPRARWYSPVFYLGSALRRRLWLDRIHVHMPPGITVVGTLGAFLVPGLGIYLRGGKSWGHVAALGYGLLLLFFVAGFGYRIGNVAFGLMLGVHACGFVYYCRPLLRDDDFGGRLGFIFVAMLAIGLAFYLPLRSFVLQHWLVPLRLSDGRVYIAQRQFPVAGIQRGDWIAYRLGRAGGRWGWETGGGHGSVQVHSGLGWGPVLAMAGDRVEFSTNGFTVNGIMHAPLPHMPQSGEMRPREKQWFIWPQFDIRGYGNTPESTISDALLQLAVVPEDDFAGKIPPRWLWRRQIIP